MNGLSKEQLIELYMATQSKLDALIENYNALCKRFFGPKSEKINPNQLSLFNESELVEDISEAENITDPVIETSRKKKKKSKNARLANIETVEHHITLEDHTCPECGKKMQELKPLRMEYLTYQPARWVKDVYIVHQYICHDCSDANMKLTIHTGDTSEVPARLIEGSFVTPSVVSHAGYDKFVMGVPFYRQEKDLNNRGIPISRQNLCRWVNESSRLYLNYVYERMHKDLLECEVLNMDETTLNCLEDKSNQENYIWAAMSGKYEAKQMVLYFYSGNRRYDNVNRILGDHYRGVIQSDGYQSYNDYSGTDKKAGCWAHLRRKVYEAVIVDEKLFKTYKRAGREEKRMILEENPSFKLKLSLLAKVDRLFENEKKCVQLKPEEILEKRKEEDTALLEEIRVFMETHAEDFLPKGKMGTALTYLKNQWEALNYFMQDGRIPLSNNIMEREGIKPIVMSRKNFLFADTINGAEQSMIWFSLLISARMNQLNPERYIAYVLEQLSTYGLRDDIIENCLPYSKNIPASIKLPAHSS